MYLFLGWNLIINNEFMYIMIMHTNHKHNTNMHNHHTDERNMNFGLLDLHICRNVVLVPPYFAEKPRPYRLNKILVTK